MYHSHRVQFLYVHVHIMFTCFIINCWNNGSCLYSQTMTAVSKVEHIETVNIQGWLAAIQ